MHIKIIFTSKKFRFYAVFFEIYFLFFIFFFKCDWSHTRGKTLIHKTQAPKLAIVQSACEHHCDGWLNDWGYLESLAFRAFDKILIVRHWLSKTLKLALASGAFFFFEKCFYYILSKLFSKLKNVFQKCFQMVFQKLALMYFRMCEAFLIS